MGHGPRLWPEECARPALATTPAEPWKVLTPPWDPLAQVKDLPGIQMQEEGLDDLGRPARQEPTGR